MNVALWRLCAACAGLLLITAVLVIQIERRTDSVLAQASADQPFPLRAFERYLPLEKAEHAGGVSVGDLNGDGWPDIVLANGGHWPQYSRVLLNDGRGHFLGSNLSESPARSFCTVLTDIDGDGDLDIVLGNDNPDRKTIFKNDGKGKFTSAGSWGEATRPTRFVTVGDLNGDGFPDIVAANAGASLPLPLVYPSFACLNDGTGAFPRCISMPSESTVLIPLADFDGDGALDLLIPHRDGGRGFVVWTDGKIASAQRSADWEPKDGIVHTPFRDRTFFGPEKMAVRVAAVGDLDGDGRPDFVMYDSISKRTSIFLNSGARTFHEAYTLPVGTRLPYTIAVADMNRDGRPDIVIGYFNSDAFLKFRGGEPSRGSVFFNQGKGRGFIEVPWNDGKGAVQQIAIADMDKDGWPDIVANLDIVGNLDGGVPSGIWYSTSPASHR